MKRLNILIRLFLGIILGLSLVMLVMAQAKKAAQPTEDRISGIVQMIDKKTSTITVRRDNIRRLVVYNENTKFTKVNEPGSLDEVKEGVRVICLGKFDEKARLIATRVDVRLPK